MHFWKWLPFYSTHIAIITVALDCSATIPIQKAGKHGNSTQLLDEYNDLEDLCNAFPF